MKSSTTPDKGSISLELCSQLSPLIMGVNNKGKILFVSERLSEKIGLKILGKSIFEIFKVEGEAKASIINRRIDSSITGKLLLMSSESIGFALRGSLVLGQIAKEPCYIYVASPWLSWIYDNTKNPDIHIEDFPAGDAQLEYQLSLFTSKEMLQDLDAFSKKLMQTKREAEIAMQARTKFVRHVSHEMRTPLNGIISSLRLLKEEKNAARKDWLLGITERSANVLMELINQVLDFSRAEEGVFAQANVLINLDTFTSEIEATLASRAAEKHIHLHFEIDLSLPEAVCADKQTFKMCFINIIGNAIKYSKSDIIVCRISYEDDSGSQYLLGEVEDFGIGLSKADCENIFKPFWTAENKTPNENSTGLGLAIVKETLTKIGGKISIDSMIGQGTRFTFSIPAALDGCQESNSSDRKPVIDDTSLQKNIRPLFKGKVLLVDDNQINLELATIQLQNFGLAIVTATNGKEAIEAESAHDFDIVLMDIEMPIMDGTKAAKEIRENGRNPSLSIIALTANVSEDDLREYKIDGIDDTLTKPVSQEQLTRILEQYLPIAPPAPVEEHSSEESSPAEVMPEAVPILDTTVLNALINDVGAVNAERIINLYIQEATDQVRAINEHIQGESPWDAGRPAHRLASSSLSFGLIRLGELLRHIEQSSKDHLSIERETSQELTLILDKSLNELKAACHSIDKS